MRILVVEDEHRLAGALKRGLQQEGYAVDIAPDGKEGLWLATEQEYDVIVPDIMLPGLNGFQVCKSLGGGSVDADPGCSRQGRGPGPCRGSRHGGR
ncbi:MAG: response regulator [Acidimicrobiales bacterium]